MKFRVKKIRTQTYDQSILFNPKTGEIIQFTLVFKAKQATGKAGSLGVDAIANKLGIDGKALQITEIDKRPAYIYFNPKYFPKIDSGGEDE